MLKGIYHSLTFRLGLFGILTVAGTYLAMNHKWEWFILLSTGKINCGFDPCISKTKPHHTSYNPTVTRLVELIRFFQRICFYIILNSKQNSTPFVI